jgi:hypothetical protein
VACRTPTWNGLTWRFVCAPQPTVARTLRSVRPLSMARRAIFYSNTSCFASAPGHRTREHLPGRRRCSPDAIHATVSRRSLIDRECVETALFGGL